MVYSIFRWVLVGIIILGAVVRYYCCFEMYLLFFYFGLFFVFERWFLVFFFLWKKYQVLIFFIWQSSIREKSRISFLFFLFVFRFFVIFFVSWKVGVWYFLDQKRDFLCFVEFVLVLKYCFIYKRDLRYVDNISYYGFKKYFYQREFYNN